MKMKINHEQTKTKINEVIGLLRSQALYAKNFRKEALKVNQDEMLAQKYKNDKLAELRAAYNAKYEETKTKLA